MQRIRCSLTISAEELKAYYRGHAKNVRAQSLDGRSIQFPAAVLRSFMTHDGINGVFELVIDDNNKLVQFNRVA